MLKYLTVFAQYVLRCVTLTLFLCILKTLSTPFQRKNTLRVLLALCEGNLPVTGGFPSQRADNEESVSRSWRHMFGEKLRARIGRKSGRLRPKCVAVWHIMDSSKGTHPWWRHQMEAFSALLAICAGNSPVPGEFPAQRPVTWSFDVFFDLRLNKRLSKQSWGWWFETLSRLLWRHRNATKLYR